MLATAGSIAHELRTPLLAIRAGAAGLGSYLPLLLETYGIAKDGGNGRIGEAGQAGGPWAELARRRPGARAQESLRRLTA